MLGLAYDIRNRVRRLLFHANKAPAWRGAHFQVLNRHLPDPEIMSNIIDLKGSSAVLSNGNLLYKPEEAAMLALTITRLNKKLAKLHRHIRGTVGHIHNHTIDFNAQDDIGDILFQRTDGPVSDVSTWHISLESVQTLIDKIRKVTHHTLRISHAHNIHCLEHKLNAHSQESDKAMYAYLNIDRGTPSASVYDPITKKNIFHTKQQLQVMAQQWQTILSMHAESPPQWDAFHETYSHYSPHRRGSLHRSAFSKLSLQKSPKGRRAHGRWL